MDTPADSPDDWRVSVQPRTRRTVYTNTRTGVVTWFKPDALKTELERLRDNNQEYALSGLLAERAQKAAVRSSGLRQHTRSSLAGLRNAHVVVVVAVAIRSDGKVPINAHIAQNLPEDVVVATEDTPLPAHNIGHRYAAPHPHRHHKVSPLSAIVGDGAGCSARWGGQLVPDLERGPLASPSQSRQ